MRCKARVILGFGAPRGPENGFMESRRVIQRGDAGATSRGIRECNEYRTNSYDSV